MSQHHAVALQPGQQSKILSQMNKEMEEAKEGGREGKEGGTGGSQQTGSLRTVPVFWDDFS